MIPHLLFRCLTERHRSNFGFQASAAQLYLQRHPRYRGVAPAGEACQNRPQRVVFDAELGGEPVHQSAPIRALMSASERENNLPYDSPCGQFKLVSTLNKLFSHPHLRS